MVSISVCGAEEPGLIPGRGVARFVVIVRSHMPFQHAFPSAVGASLEMHHMHFPVQWRFLEVHMRGMMAMIYVLNIFI